MHIGGLRLLSLLDFIRLPSHMKMRLVFSKYKQRGDSSLFPRSAATWDLCPPPSSGSRTAVCSVPPGRNVAKLRKSGRSLWLLRINIYLGFEEMSWVTKNKKQNYKLLSSQTLKSLSPFGQLGPEVGKIQRKENKMHYLPPPGPCPEDG